MDTVACKHVQVSLRLAAASEKVIEAAGRPSGPDMGAFSLDGNFPHDFTEFTGARNGFTDNFGDRGTPPAHGNHAKNATAACFSQFLAQCSRSW